jgi:alkaline phosphatase D
MPGTLRSGATLSRRRLLASASAAGALTLISGVARPYLSRAADRPRITHGVQSGDISADGGIVWARADRPSRMLVEAATTESFRNVIATTSIDATAKSDFTAKALLAGLPAGQDIFYRVAFADIGSPTIVGEHQVGRFRTAPDKQRSVSFAWSGDTVGCWGIDEARGGMRTYATVLRNRPDFFVHCGDNIYADCPLPREQKLPNGEIWRNVLTEEKSRVAETLADYRGNYKYNLIDHNLRAFNAEVPVFAQWDDHEVTDDWYPGMPLHVGDADITALAARGCQAFHEFTPTREFAAERGRIYRKIAYGPHLDVFMLDMRSYRGPNSDGKQEAYSPAAHFLGPAQVAWLKRELAASRATWKVIAADLPIGLMSYDAAAQGDGPPLGRELEIADLLSFMKHAGVHNTIWITADMHYTAAHYYNPDKAQFQDFEPFWEFMSGPIHAGTGRPGMLDDTFGPRAVYFNACGKEEGDDLAPCFGKQYFGHVAIDGANGVMTVTLKDVEDRALWAIDLTPQMNAPHARA